MRRERAKGGRTCISYLVLRGEGWEEKVAGRQKREAIHVLDDIHEFRSTYTIRIEHRETRSLIDIRLLTSTGLMITTETTTIVKVR